MGMGGGGGGQDMGTMFQIMQAAQARDEENRRQARIQSGRDLIDRQFDLFKKDPAFFDRYRNGITDYYRPQIDKQYADAKRNLTFQLADAGTLRSTAAADSTAELARQNDSNIVSMNAKADSAVGDLRNQIASNKDTAINQLYSTEDPSIAANTALNGIANVQLAKPDLSPLANLFSTAAIGGANAVKAWQQGGGGSGGLGFGGNESAGPGGGSMGKSQASFIGG
jgi:hypothetical protein